MAKKGLTLVEVIIASLVVAVVAGGTMMVFIASANMTGPYSGNVTSPSSVQGPQDLPSLGEANDLAQQTLESFRNEVVAQGPSLLASQAGLGWQSANPTMPPTDTASKLTGVKRCYRVVSTTCGSDSCYEVQTQVCWNKFTTCSCP